MPKKLNSAGQMQNYVPAGNGDASGEYGDNATGSNKHFKAFYKSQVEGEITGSNGKETLVKHSEIYNKIKQNIKMQLENKETAFFNNTYDDVMNDMVQEGKITENEASELLKLLAQAKEELDFQKKEKEKAINEVKEKQLQEEEKAIKKQEVEEGKKLLKDIKPVDKKIEKQLKAYKTKEKYLGYLNQFEDEFDKEKLEQLNEEELKQLVIAKQNTLDKEKDYNKKYLKQIKELNTNENSDYGKIWGNSKNIPKNYEDFVNALEDKENWFKQFELDKLKEQLDNANTESGKQWVQSKIDSINNGLNTIDEIKQNILPQWEQAFKDSESLKESKKLSEKVLNKFADVNSVYTQKAKDNAHWFKSYTNAKNYFGDMKETYDKINKTDLDYIKDYTSSYSFINEPLRKLNYQGSKGDKEKFLKHVKGMTNAINQSKLKENMWVQRGIWKLNLNGQTLDENSNIDSLVGTTFEDQGFVSCSAHKGAGFGSGKGVILNIYAPKGTKALYVDPISHYSGSSEDEIILQRGYNYKITKAYKENGRVYLDCEVVLGSDIKKYDDKELEDLANKHF